MLVEVLFFRQSLKKTRLIKIKMDWKNKEKVENETREKLIIELEKIEKNLNISFYKLEYEIISIYTDDELNKNNINNKLK